MIDNLQTQCWVPLVATQFPANSPFMLQQQQQQQEQEQQRKGSSTSNLRLPETQSPNRSRSVKRSNREVKFQKPIK